MDSSELGFGPQQTKPGEPLAPGRVETILVVDSDAARRKATAGILRDGGYATREAADHAEARRGTQQESPDLIVLDVALPDRLGFELMRQLKAAPETAHIPVLHISTDHDNEASVAAGLDAGAEACLTRPVHPIVLLATCRSLLRLAEAVRRATEALRLSERRAKDAETGRRLAETLNAEISHRVKNNLAMVAALIQMQSTAGDVDKKAAKALQETAGRVMTFARIYEQLEVEAEGQINLLQVVRQLTTMVKEMVAGKQIHLEVEGEPVLLDAKTATSLAMVANELLVNAAKHGAPSPSGELHIRVELKAEEGKLHLSVWNSGRPLPGDGGQGELAGLGLQLVRGLIAQHQGRFAFKAYKGGSLAEVVITAPKLQRPFSSLSRPLQAPVCRFCGPSVQYPRRGAGEVR